MSAVHPQVTPRHKAAGIAEEEDSSAAVFARLGKAAEHVVLGPLVTTLRELVEEHLDHSGHNVAGGDGVDADVVLAPFGGEVATELEDCCFAGIVCGTKQSLTSQFTDKADAGGQATRNRGGEEAGRIARIIFWRKRKGTYPIGNSTTHACD